MLESLALTGLGGLLAVTGTIIGHHWQALEARRLRREEHEREDRYRLHRDRKEAYAAFHLQFGNARRVMREYSDSDGDAALLEKVREARDEVWRAIVYVWHIGSPNVVSAADEIMKEIEGVGWRGKGFNPSRWGDLVGSYVDFVRSDLHGGQAPPVVMTFGLQDPSSSGSNVEHLPS